MSQAKIREGSVLAVVVDEATKTLVFNVRGAAPDGGSKSLSFCVTEASTPNREYAELHGWKQRFVDAAALTRDPVTGKPASPADKFASIELLVDHYKSGSLDWALRAVTSERTSGELAFLVRAVVAIKGKSSAEVRDWLKSKTAAERTSLALMPAIKELIDGYRAEGAADIDSEAMLAELA